MSQDEVTEADRRWMQRAIDLSYLCPPVETAYNVGAVIVSVDGQELATGYSRETDAHVHAEESALAKVRGGEDVLQRATIYSTLEPCSQRASRPEGCAALIVAAGLQRVIIVWREPSLFVTECTGAEDLQAAGVVVLELSDLALSAKAANRHLDLESSPRQRPSS